ncbi:uncharacterized protein LOC117325922 [Pecten maximus]|uniref:uncharacterized protein LOC117325922 n=1 Tax=Pecten maximus TaxID=6579 RepID=UPI0014590EC5|nr:uncharacterized protein LOC117325922 [Pecten maximus]
MIKVVGNIGTPVQYVYDSKYTGMEGETKDRRLVQALLQCAYNTGLPHKVSKTAILALHNMTFTPEMKDTLVSILIDVNRPPSLRTTIFARLAMQPNPDLVAEILELINTEKMGYMKNYMITYVKSLLQNDQPDLQGLRSIWKELIDARKFPYVSHAFGWTKYVEMSRYIRFPFRMEYFGFQIELDTVYNIASPVVNAVVLRISYFKGQKFELLELAADIDEFHVIVDAIKIFSLPRSQGNTDSTRDGTVFATLQKNIAAAILGLFDKMNLSQTKVPDGLIHVKVLGKELFFLEVRDLLTIISQSRSKQSFQNVAVGYIHELLQQLPMKRASSTSMMDMVKILPTVAGFPMNMSVSTTMSMGLDFDARLTMPDILNLNADVQLDASLKTHASVQLNGELTTRFGQHSLSGARASFRGLVQMSVAPSLRFNTRPNPPRELDISISQTTTDSNYTIASLSGHLYLVNQSGEIEVEADPEFQTTVQDCDRGILSTLTGNQVCFTSVFPNTTSSTRHAYFPLSGPSNFKLDTRKVETETIRMSVVRSRNRSDLHFWINVTRQGQENTEGLILHIHRKDRFRLMEVIMPAAQIHFYAKEDYTWSYESLNPTNYWVYDIHLNITGRSFIRFLVKEQYHSNLTRNRLSIISSREIVDVTLAIPETSLAVTVNSFRNRPNGHYNTAINVTYHCTKARPLLYLLHWNPTLAAQNGDVSVTQVVNDVIVGYTDANLWRANDCMLLKLPGLKISVDNKMEVNLTHASHHAVIVYTMIESQEYTIIMDTQVTNRTNITDNNYAYFMLLSHNGMPYNLSVRGHVKGQNLLTEIEKVSKTEQATPTVEEKDMMAIERNMTESNVGGGIGNRGTDPCMKIPERTVLTLTLVGVPVSEGIEMRFDSNYSRQVCGEQVLYRTTGVYGRQLKNTRMNFHYWATLDMAVSKSNDTLDQQEAVVRSKSYRGNFRFRFQYFNAVHVVLDYSSQLVNTSYLLHVYQIPKEGYYLLIHCKLQTTEWPAINFNVRNLYSWTDHLIQEREVTSTWLDVNTEAHYYIQLFSSKLEIKFNHIIDSRMPWLPGRTNITGYYVDSDDGLPRLLVSLERSEGTIALKADLMNTTLGILNVTSQKLDEEAMSLFTWEMALTSSLALTHTINWNPDLAEIVTLDAVGRFRQVRVVLVEVGEVLLLNAKKPVFLMAVPYANMTVGVMIETYLYPYLQFHVQNGGPGSLYEGIDFQTTTDETENNGTDESGAVPSYTSSYADLYLRMVSRNVGKVLIWMGRVNVRPPWIVDRLIDNLLRPSVEKLLAESRIIFTAPLIRVTYSLPDNFRATYSSRYLEGVYRRLTKGPGRTDKRLEAFVFNGQYLKTYYGRTYFIPDDQAADCIHLLAGDYSRETFALLLSRQGISVVTSQMSVTLEFGGNVFRDNCPRPLRLPLGREGSRIHVLMKGDNTVLTTLYGVRVSCKHQHGMCRISLSGNLFGHSWGLLGSNDGESGSDFQLPTKYITPVTSEFIQGYVVGGPPKCISLGSANQTGFDEELHPHHQVLSNIQARCSEDMANECNRQFTHAKTVSSCGSYVSPQLFLDSCLSEARSCGRVAYDACKHIRAYQYACSLKFVYDTLHVNCSLESASRKGDGRRPVDIVLVVDENLGSSRTDIEAHVETLLHIVKYNLRNVQLGIVGYGGNVQISKTLGPTASTRYMVTLDTLDVGTDNSQWKTAWKRLPNVDTMDGALDMAANYPYRLNTQRVVIVMSRDENPYVSDDVKSTFENLNIIVNSFGSYDSVDPSDKSMV